MIVMASTGRKETNVNLVMDCRAEILKTVVFLSIRHVIKDFVGDITMLQSISAESRGLNL
jgi:hypothetical protein